MADVGLNAASFEAVLLETWHVKPELSPTVVKTDGPPRGKDARGIAQLLRIGDAGPKFRRRGQ